MGASVSSFSLMSRGSEQVIDRGKWRELDRSYVSVATSLFTHSAPFVCHSPPFRGDI